MIDPDRLAGYDPYDVLRGSRIPKWIRKTPRGRQLVTQVRKNLPVEIGPALGVAPFVMAKTVACFLSAAVRRAAAEGRACREDILALVGALESTAGNLGEGRWGYEFDVQTRWAYYPAGTPNLIVTVFAGRALLEAGLHLGDELLIGRAHEAARFAVTLLRKDGNDTFFAYLPASNRLVHNANALGAGLCAAVGKLLEDGNMLALSSEAAVTTANATTEEGRWSYGRGHALSWSDNFHTAYTLDGLAQVAIATEDRSLALCVAEAAAAWRRDFFRGGIPYYYVGCSGPVDIHCCGTSIDVAARLELCRIASLGDLAVQVRDWTARRMVEPMTGATYFRRYWGYMDRRHFVRWGDAHVALGMASCECLERTVVPPLEAHILGGAL